MATRTFLFVDQASSTEQLTELGDLVAQRVRRTLFQLLRRANALNGGEEVDFAGDGLFCAFEGASEAVDAAVMMQELVASSNRRHPEGPRLEIRVGLNSGEALASEGGGYFGVAVVIAARLCAAAGGGRILASEIVRTLVEPQGEHAFEPSGSYALKGVPDPVAGYRVAWSADTPAVALPTLLTAALPDVEDDESTRAPQLVGREAELLIAAQAWSSVEQGGRRLLLMTGVPGIGVTRLAAEIARSHGLGTSTVMAGAALGRSSRLAPWARALEDWMHTVPRADLRFAVGEDGPALLRLVPTLRRLIPRLREPTPEQPGDEIADLAAAIDRLVSRWSELEPIVLVLDRLDQADATSLEILRYLMESTLPARLLIVAGYRAAQVGSPAVGAALGRLTGVLNVDLHGLSSAETLQLVSSVTGEALEPASLRAVYAESAGTPARVIQLGVALRERALTRRAEDALGRVAELRSDIRAQRVEIAQVVQQLEQLRYDEVDGRQRDHDDGDPSTAVPSPYKGLAAYQPEDADDFYGRELLVAELVAKLASSRFLAVVGPSGSGKSSVVRAGLIPALARESVPGSSTWVPVIFTPASESIADALRRGRDMAHGQPIALFVDQFEELWTAGQQGEEGGAAGSRADALNLLVTSIEDLDEQAVVVVSMRADYYGRTAEHPELASLMSESQVLVPPMTPGELRRAIEAPARRAGLTLEQGLVQAAILDVGDGAGRLPLLSTAMLETWQRRQGSALTLAGYAAAGGARRAIATLAESAYGAMTEEEQEAARRIFLRLADPDDDEGDVARVATLEELGDAEATRRVLDQLAARRLVTVSATTVQVAHEALLREWPRLHGWLATDRDGRRLHHQISSMAHDWDVSGREPEALVRGARLTVASEWADANPTELTVGEGEFLRASEAAHQSESVRRRRQVRRLQILSFGLVALLVLASVALGFGVVQARLAGTRATEATASELSAQAAALASVNSDTSLLLAVEGYRRDPSVNTEGGLLTALNGARFRNGTAAGLPKDISDFELSKDGSTLYLMTGSGSIYAADTGALNSPPRRLVSGVKNGTTIALSHSQTLLAYGADDGVSVVDARSGKHVAGPFGPSGGQGEFMFDDRSLLLGAYPTPGVSVVDIATGKVAKHDLFSGSPAVAAASPTTDEFVAAPVFGDSVRRFRVDGTVLGAAVKTPIESISGLLYSPDGKEIALGGLSNDGAVIDSTKLTTTSSPFKIRGSRVSDVAFDPGSGQLAVGSDDGSVEIVDPKTGRSVHRLSGLEGPVNAAFLDDHRILAATRSTAVVFDLDRLTVFGPSNAPTASSASVFSILRDPADSTALVTSYGSMNRVTASLKSSTTPIGASVSGLGDAAISSDGALLAVYDGQPGGAAQLEVADRASDTVSAVVKLPDNDGSVPKIAFSPNGRSVAVRVGDGSLTVVDVTKGRLRFPAKRYDPLGASGALAWSPDGSSVYFGGQSGVLDFIDPRTGAVTRTLSLSPSYALDGIAAVPGTHLDAVSSESGFVYLFDTRTRRVSGQPLSAGGTQLQNVAVSPDGDRVVAISRDGALRIWDTASRRSIGPAIAAHDVQAGAIAFLSDTRLVTGDLAGGLASWDLDPASWVDTACRLVGHDLTKAEWQQYLPDQPYRKTCSSR